MLTKSLVRLESIEELEQPESQVCHSGSQIMQAREEVFRDGGIHFAVLQSLINLVKARSIGVWFLSVW